ncbi:hypothetical protein HMPREF1986_02883 [Oribacterium sp. oral taxon 078 str. F0263]|nr:hypothetical protein HMPREF1986_02883 [Oribacterium sp. oral taxon 078 str. F0263]
MAVRLLRGGSAHRVIGILSVGRQSQIRNRIHSSPLREILERERGKRQREGASPSLFL